MALLLLLATCLACGWLARRLSSGATCVFAAGRSLGFALLGLGRVARGLWGSAPRLVVAGAEAGWLCSLAVDASAELGLAPIPPGPPLKLVRLPLFVTF